MTDKEWDELMWGDDQSNRSKELIAKTELEDEHPEDYHGPCFCKLCQSYADIQQGPQTEMGGEMTGEKAPEIVREHLAKYAHNAWSGWMQYLFEKSTLNNDGTVTIPKWAVDRWTRQSNKNYTELPEDEKDRDRHEADRMLAIINGG